MARVPLVELKHELHNLTWVHANPTNNAEQVQQSKTGTFKIEPHWELKRPRGSINK